MAHEQTLEELYAIIKGRKETPKEGSYTNYLFDKDPSFGVSLRPLIMA